MKAMVFVFAAALVGCDRPQTFDGYTIIGKSPYCIVEASTSSLTGTPSPVSCRYLSQEHCEFWRTLNSTDPNTALICVPNPLFKP